MDELDQEFEAARQADEPEGQVVEQEAPEAPEPDIDAAPQDEAPEAPQPEAPQPEAPQTVPLATFLELKNEFKEVRDELRRMRETPPEEPPKAPDKDEDPLGYLEHQGKVTQATLEQLKQNLEQRQSQDHVNHVRQEIQRMENAFAQEHKDYWQAVKHLTDARIAQYRVMGVTNPEQAIKDETAWMVQNALQSRKNPAEVVYELAKQFGYSTQTKQSASLKDLARAQESASTLANSHGESPKESLSVEDANEMSDDEFDKRFLGDDKEFEKLFAQ